jgi:uncharacterized membrane protein
MRRLVSYFLRGLVFVAPLAVTVYACFKVFQFIDGWLRLSVPGLGFAVTVAVITLIGFLASTILATGVLSAVDSAVNRLPFVRLLYSATKDLLNAFVGEHPRFDSPVLVPADHTGRSLALGFVTQDSLARLGMADHVTVYLPFSYSLSGRLVIYPAAAVQRLDTDSPEVLAFIVSGGVTEVPALKIRPTSTPSRPASTPGATSSAD